MARVAAVENGLRPISTGAKLAERSVRVAGKQEAIRLLLHCPFNQALATNMA
jgi:hypothetical protein